MKNTKRKSKVGEYVEFGMGVRVLVGVAREGIWKGNNKDMKEVKELVMHIIEGRLFQGERITVIKALRWEHAYENEEASVAQTEQMRGRRVGDESKKVSGRKKGRSGRYGPY